MIAVINTTTRALHTLESLIQITGSIPTDPAPADLTNADLYAVVESYRENVSEVNRALVNAQVEILKSADYQSYLEEKIWFKRFKKRNERQAERRRQSHAERIPDPYEIYREREEDDESGKGEPVEATGEPG